MAESYTIAFDLLSDIILWKYPSDSFDASSSLLIKNNQKAVILHNGIVCDVLDMGVYLPSLEATPGLYKKLGLAEGYRGMIKADLWFVNMKESPDLHWQTVSIPTGHADSSYPGAAKYHAAGMLRYSIVNPASIFASVQPSNKSYTATQFFDLLEDDFGRAMLQIIQAQLHHDNKDVSQLQSHFDSLAGFCRHTFNESQTGIKGYELTSFDVQSLDVNTPLSPPRPPVADLAIDIDRVLSTPDRYGKYLKPILWVAAVIIGIVLYQLHSKASIASKKRQSHWRYYKSYYVDQAGDSSLTSQYAFLSSDEDIADINKSFFPYYHTSVELNVDNKSSNHIALFFAKGELAPIKEGTYRYVYLRFDQAPEIQVRIDSYKKGEDIIYMYDPGLSTDRVMQCKKLTIKVANTTQDNKTVPYTFSTSGMKWE